MENMEQYRAEIEDFSAGLEQQGFSPVVARVYLYLLFVGDEGAEFEDLTQFFSVSKSAVSNALKHLSEKNIVHFKTYGGQRKRRFYIDLDTIQREATSSLKLEAISAFFYALADKRNKDDEYTQKLKNLALLIKMFCAEIPLIVQRWKNIIDN